MWDIFDKKIALIADAETILDRLITRTNHTFGKNEDERNLVLKNMNKKNAMYKQMGAILIDATRPIKEVVGDVISASSYHY